MKQICKNCGLEYESPFEEYKCYNCKEEEKDMNEKVRYQLIGDITKIMDEILINPSFFKLTVTSDIENLKAKIRVEDEKKTWLNKTIEINIKRSRDDFEFLNDYKGKFINIFSDNFKKNEYKSSH
ncbi:MAG: hypothetical protein LBV03_09160 [Fusobacteriales bacterium]|jgi:hypothetical protein|nr:hypothetical protein [Fusobacteriales bacterium]